MKNHPDFRSKYRATLPCARLPADYLAASTGPGKFLRPTVRQSRVLGDQVMWLSWQAAMVAAYILVGAWLIYVL